MNKKEVVENLKKANSLLLDCQLAIAELNEDGSQFDYCTDATLSNITDTLVNRIKSIEATVYQEYKN
jgi:hypothetical protein